MISHLVQENKNTISKLLDSGGQRGPSLMHKESTGNFGDEVSLSIRR